MGYRSEVKLVLSKNDELAKRTDHWELWISGKGAGSLLKNLEEMFDVEHLENEVVFSANWLKWYPEYPDVAAIESYMDWLDNEDLSGHYQFIRIGEEFNDIEFRGDLTLFYVSRTIELA